MFPFSGSAPRSRTVVVGGGSEFAVARYLCGFGPFGDQEVVTEQWRLVANKHPDERLVR